MKRTRRRAKPRADHRWRRRLAQLERIKGLKPDPRYTAALDHAMRAHMEADPTATCVPLEEVLKFAPPGSAGLRFYRDVPKAIGPARNRQIRRRKVEGC